MMIPLGLFGFIQLVTLVAFAITFIIITSYLINILIDRRPLSVLILKLWLLLGLILTKNLVFALVYEEVYVTIFIDYGNTALILWFIINVMEALVAYFVGSQLFLQNHQTFINTKRLFNREED